MIGIGRVVWLAPALALLLAGCGGGGGEDEPLGGDSPAATTIPYRTVIEGELPGDVSGYLLSASLTAQNESRPPTSTIILRRRASEDIARLETALRDQGYYEGSVDYRIDLEEPRGEDEESTLDTIGEAITGPPNSVVFIVDSGPRFTFEERRIDLSGETEFEPPEIADIGLKQDEPAIAQNIITAEATLLRRAAEQGYPFAEIVDRSIIVDFDAKSMDVAFALDSGPLVAFGEPVFSPDEIEGIDVDYLMQQVQFEPGDAFDLRAMEGSRRGLVETNLFSTVRVEPDETVNEQGRLPVNFTFNQRRHRTIGAGIGFDTDDGPNARVFWEHRNLLSSGEQLLVEGFVSQSDQSLTGRFRKRDVLFYGVDLIGDASVRNQETDAFDSRSIGAGLGLETEFNEHVRGSLGVAYRYAEVTDQDGDEDIVGLFSVPATLGIDYSDSLLDPSKGWRLQLSGAPFLDTLGVGTRFLKLRGTGTVYQRIANEPRLVAAFRGSVGSITGASIGDIPADERFFAGGGGSVRGIPFQLAGPLEDGEPVGGRSVIEGSAEIRYRAFESIEFVSFFDAGSVFEEVAPTFDNDLEMGAGVGLRYITPVGPLRLDVAVPIDRRRGIDDRFQLYISIGQAF